ncbi:MAG: DUF349 domain-containing protein [Thiohalocapsa sp.]
MFLKRLFGRRTEARALTHDREQLIETALNAPDSTARRDACHALADLPTLRRIAIDDSSAGIRDLAAARYRKLLCGIDTQSPPLPERLAELAQVEDQLLIAQVALQASDAELRHAAIVKLTTPAALADCAVDDALAANRLSAAERLFDKPALEQVAPRAAKRDKRVYRLVRQRLKDINDREERPRLVRAQCEALCEKLERLGRFDNWVQDHALLGHLEHQWAELEPEADAHAKKRYQALRQAFLDAYATYAEHHATQIAEEQARAAAAHQRQALIMELGELCRQSDLDPLNLRLSEIEQAWAQLEQDDAADNSVTRAYREALTAVRAQSERLELAARRAQAAKSLQRDAQTMVERGGEVVPEQVRRLRKRLDLIVQDGGTDNDLSPCKELLDKLQQRIDKHRAHVSRKLAALPERLAELDQHFEQGRLKKAEPLYQSITATLEQARSAGLPRQELAPAEAHLKGIAPQLRELQRWRRWGADTKRDDLCTEIEALADDAEHELEPMSNRLLELRDAWRQLDRNGAPADDALWHRFKAAAERVHERCRPFLEAQAKIRAANQTQREALCAQLETFLDQADWERMDWKKAARAEREMRQAWGALGRAQGPLSGPDIRKHKALEGHFHKLLRSLDKTLDAERERNRSFRQDLITRMQTLVDEPDLRRATDAAKELQQQWHTTVTGRQREENALWQSFRAASDAVFSRRAAQHEAKTAELRENQATREALCDELLALAEQASDSDALRSSLRAIETRWNDTEGLPLPRQAAQSLQRRWREAGDIATERLRALEQAHYWTAIEHLEQRSAFCDAAARDLLSAPDVVETTMLREQWAALPIVADEPAAARLDDTFSQIIEAATAADARSRLEQQMADNAARRLDLCLHLEITAGAESPKELQQQRMELQVSRLRDSMAGRSSDDADPLADASSLLQDWYLCVPSAAIEGLHERFVRAKQALTGAHHETGDA